MNENDETKAVFVSDVVVTGDQDGVELYIVDAELCLHLPLHQLYPLIDSMLFAAKISEQLRIHPDFDKVKH